jgi:hypothetical protein
VLAAQNQYPYYSSDVPRPEHETEHLGWIKKVSGGKKIKRFSTTSNKDKNYNDYFVRDEKGREIELRTNGYVRAFLWFMALKKVYQH